MRLASVEFPPQLLAARRAGRLVVFAGAGVSRPAPSSLPDFECLVGKLAVEHLPRNPNEPPDRYLGRLAHARIPVHRNAARELSPPEPRPNELHRLLVEVFPRPEHLRIVTTNFDHHLEAALAARWPHSPPPIYAAPALPIGSRFSGLVYVHGRLGGDPEELVLTDGDFGRAYLTEGWARRFLVEVFAAYDILFIGYSHQDTILSYLARGLPAGGECQRFALTPRGDRERWRLLDITPLEYDDAGEHSVLPQALSQWLDLERQGALGHERRVRDLVERPPEELSEESEEYLLGFCMTDPQLAQFFYRYALDVGWLKWAAQRSLVASLFEAGDEDDREALAGMAGWFVREALSARGAVARGLAQPARRLPRRLWHAIANRVRQDLDVEEVPGEAAESAAQWLALLDRHGRAASDHELIGHWLKRLSAERHTYLAVQIFIYLTRPMGVAEASWRGGTSGEPLLEPQPAVRIRADRFWLKLYWTKLFAPNLHLFARHLA